MAPATTAFRAAMMLPLLFGMMDAVQGEPAWHYDGVAYAQIYWKNGSSPILNQQTYSSFTVGALAVAVTDLSDAHGISNLDGPSAGSVATAELTGPEATTSSNARANNTLSGLAAGDYLVSFDYAVGPQSNDVLATTHARVGFELPKIPTVYWEYAGQGAGHYSAQLYLDQWINFYAISSSSAVDGAASTFAQISNVSVTLVPEPESAWLLAAGLVLVGRLAWKRRRRDIA